MPEMIFEGIATWTGETECKLSVKGKDLVTVSPPPSFGGKEGYCVPEDIFAAALASCINTLFLLIAKKQPTRIEKPENQGDSKDERRRNGETVIYKRPFQHECGTRKRQRT